MQCSSSSFCTVNYGSNDKILSEGGEIMDNDDSCNIIRCLVSLSERHAKLKSLVTDRKINCRETTSCKSRKWNVILLAAVLMIKRHITCLEVAVPVVVRFITHLQSFLFLRGKKIFFRSLHK